MEEQGGSDPEQAALIASGLGCSQLDMKCRIRWTDEVKELVQVLRGDETSLEVDSD